MNWLSKIQWHAPWVRRLRALIFLAAIFYLAATVWRLFLPSESVEHIKSEPVNYFRNYPFERALAITNTPAAPKEEPAHSQQVYQLTSLKVKGIYAKADGTGFVVVEEGRSVHFINHGEEFKGYKLERIEARRALFDRAGRQYELTLQEVGPAATVTPSPSASQSVTRPQRTGRQDTQQLMQNVPRTELDRYRQDARLIWDNIGILPVSENGEFKEFRVSFVAPGSVFEQLGLQAGDVLKEANGVRLDGYAAALRLYAEIDKIEAFRLVIERNNQTRELEYEIR